MARRIFNLLTLLSLLLFAAVVALWVRSYWVVDELSSVRGETRRVLTTAGGRFDLVVTDDEVFRRVPQGWRWRHQHAAGSVRDLWRSSISSPLHPYVKKPSRPMRLGFWWGTLLQPGVGGASVVPSFVLIGPVWPAALPWAVLPGLWFVRRCRQVVARRRRQRGLCPGCGYDLRATPGRCPECGMAGGGAA